MELDLALDREGVTLQPSDHPDLLAESIWSRRLNQWIEAISNDAALACPGSVQEAEEVSLGLRFTDDTTIAELNNTWRQKTGPTDVLSFAALEEAEDWIGGPCLELGDIVVSVDTARRQASDHQHSLEHELRWLVSHGLLHLLGWDHPDEMSLNSMLALQEQLLGIDQRCSPGKVRIPGARPADPENGSDDS